MIQFRLAQVWALCKLALAYIISLFYKRGSIWLVCERGVDARDNGYWFFRYLRTHYSEIKAYYLITKNSPDRERVQTFADYVIDFRSMRHYVMLWRASVLISTHIQGYFPFVGLGLWVKKKFKPYRDKKHISLQHGITCNYIPFLDYKNTQLDLIISGVKMEYDNFVNKYHYPQNKICLTGFCRYDNLNQNECKRQILIMPTWREWLYQEETFFASDYLKKYVSLLKNTQLLKLLNDYDVDVVFYPHHEVQKHIWYFLQHCSDKHIIIAAEDQYDVQDLLKESALLITDFSSVYFDFTYMHKPVIYYQFDVDQFRKEHYQKGWYSYEQGLGPVSQTEDELLQLLEGYIQKDFQMEELYAKRAEELFVHKDTNNCLRVYEAILAVEKRKGYL